MFIMHFKDINILHGYISKLSVLRVFKEVEGYTARWKFILKFASGRVNRSENSDQR